MGARKRKVLISLPAVDLSLFYAFNCNSLQFIKSILCCIMCLFKKNFYSYPCDATLIMRVIPVRVPFMGQIDLFENY